MNAIRQFQRQRAPDTLPDTFPDTFHQVVRTAVVRLPGCLLMPGRGGNGMPHQAAQPPDAPPPAPPARLDAEACIVAIAQARDRAAFAALFGYFAPRVKSYLLRHGAPPAAAEDLAQEAMLTVWRKAATFDRERAGASTWIFTIARNLRVDSLRRERWTENPVLDQAPAEDRPSGEPGAEAMLLANEDEACLRTALRTLPLDQARVVQLSFFQGLPHAEIGRELGIPLGTVKSRLRLAMTRLRTAMDQKP